MRSAFRVPCLKSLKSLKFEVPCSVLGYRSFCSIGIAALGECSDIVEDMSAFKESLKSLKFEVPCSAFRVSVSKFLFDWNSSFRRMS